MRGRWLFALTLGLAGLLVAAVLLCPWLDGDRVPRPVTLFARDALVRQTALASAVGLTVTAFLFFIPTHSDDKRSPPRGPRSPGAIGA